MNPQTINLFWSADDKQKLSIIESIVDTSKVLNVGESIAELFSKNQDIFGGLEWELFYGIEKYSISDGSTFGDTGIPKITSLKPSDTEDKTILVFYVDVRGLTKQQRYEEIKKSEHVHSSKGFTQFHVPIKGETKVECINPKMITPKEYMELNDRLEEISRSLNKTEEQYDVVNIWNILEIFKNTKGIEYIPICLPNIAIVINGKKELGKQSTSYKAKGEAIDDAVYDFHETLKGTEYKYFYIYKVHKHHRGYYIFRGIPSKVKFKGINGYILKDREIILS